MKTLTNHVRRCGARGILLALAFLAVAPLFAADIPLGGTWQFDRTRSSELTPWQDYTLTLSIEGSRVTFRRQLGAGRRGFSDTMSIDTTKADNVVPVTMWPDNRHLGAYIADDHLKHVRAEWLDDGRILRLSTDLTLSTQQGDRAINILSDYKVSANGAVLTLTELRSTRNRPVVYVFNRAKEEKK